PCTVVDHVVDLVYRPVYLPLRQFSHGQLPTPRGGPVVLLVGSDDRVHRADVPSPPAGPAAPPRRRRPLRALRSAGTSRNRGVHWAHPGVRTPGLMAPVLLPRTSKDRDAAKRRIMMSANPITCSNCGTENPPGQDFCRKCHQPLTASAE